MPGLTLSRCSITFVEDRHMTDTCLGHFRLPFKDWQLTCRQEVPPDKETGDKGSSSHPGLSGRVTLGQTVTFSWPQIAA